MTPPNAKNRIVPKFLRIEEISAFSPSLNNNGAIPLAACFAFGAALGPTDAVAVSSLSGRVNIPKKAMHILEGEGG